MMDQKELGDIEDFREHVDKESPPIAFDEREEYDNLLLKFDQTRQKALLRKIDLRLLPVLALFYLVSYMDRTNMGNARLQGLEQDLGLSPQQYSWCLTIFFFPYALFEVPSNLVLKFLKPSIWLPIIMFFWGLVMMLMGFVQTYDGLLTARFFLGITEAGLFPGATYICTTWYKRHEQQYRVAIFYCAASLAGSFSGLLAYGIGFMEGIQGYSGWRWLFILEGLLTIVIALISKLFICDTPESAKWLTEEEKRFIVLRMQYDGHEKGYKEGLFKWKYVLQAFTDSKVYLGCVMFLIIATGTYALSFGLPTTINLLGYTAANAQLLIIPVYAFACIVTVVNAAVADRLGRRFQAVLAPNIIGLIGITICLTVSPEDKPGVIYFAMFLVASGLFPCTPAIVAWISNNLAGQWKRAVGMALEFTLGNLIGGCIGSNIFLKKEAPSYITAYRIEISFFSCGIVLAILQLGMLMNANKKREKLVTETPEEEREALDADSKDLGDKNPFFRYTL